METKKGGLKIYSILKFFSTAQKLPHTTVDIPTKFHEV
jgi:hypothetical protein